MSEAVDNLKSQVNAALAICQTHVSGRQAILDAAEQGNDPDAIWDARAQRMVSESTDKSLLTTQDQMKWID